MTQSQLKELVKEYFNLTEIKMGEVYDENKAFKIVFDGDTLELGMKVKVVTAEGQEMDAPDGYHRLEDGREIKTEGSVVTEITTAEEEKKEEMAELPAEQFPVEVTKEDQTDVAEASRTTEPELMEEMPMDTEEVVKAIVEAVSDQMEEMRKEMAEMKSKMEKMAATPAESKTLPKSKMSSESTSNTIVDKSRYEMMKKLIANKIK